MIIEGQPKDLIATVHSQADSSMVTSGVMFCVAYLEHSGADGGKFWDATSSGSWETSPALYPSGSHLEAAEWLYTIPGHASTGYSEGSIHYTFTNNLDEVFATTVSAGGEHFIRRGRPTVPGDLKLYEMEPG